MPSRGQPLYPLNVAARIVGLSPRTLRLYEEARLLEPARSGGNKQRLYSDQDVQWLRCIRDMIHDEGLTVTAIRRLLDLIPCWQVRRCPAEVALQCAPHLNIPEMAHEAALAAPESHARFAAAELQARPDGAAAEIKLIYGVEELGAVMPCSRCISAERAARKVALKYPGRVRVARYDLLSEEAGKYGALLVPTVMVDDEIVSAGKGASEERLDDVVCRHLAAAEPATANEEGR
jgi:MerR family transcriptional regulator, heat shock protein HspR